MATDESAFGPAGDPSRHLPFAALRDALDALPAAPRVSGRLGMLVRRTPDKSRETPGTVDLHVARGVPGDAWDRHANGNPEAALTVMQVDVATLIANGQPLTVFGDNLLVELDLSRENLPIGSRVRVGASLLEVTPKPHNGCHKFAARFGQDALRLVADPGLRHRNLRGIYMRVVEPGTVMVGDPVEVVFRPVG